MSSMGVARIFQRGGHTDSYRGYSSDCHLNIVSCLLTRRLTKGGSRAPQDPPLATPMVSSLSFTRKFLRKMSVTGCMTYKRRVEKLRAASSKKRRRVKRDTALVSYNDLNARHSGDGVF